MSCDPAVAPADRELLERVAARIVELHLEVPALLTLEGEPLPGLYEIDLQTGHATRRFSLTEAVRGLTVIPGGAAPPSMRTAWGRRTARGRAAHRRHQPAV